VNTPTRRIPKFFAAITAALMVAGGASAGVAQADGPQPAASGCVIQGSGTPCNMVSPAEQTAVGWAQGQEGSDLDDGYCLTFVVTAYNQAGIDITTQAGDHSSAFAYWNTYSGTKNPPSDSPPYGALVFWGATSSNPYGHVAISEGNGNAVSTTERDNTGVHEFSIADRNSDGYQEVGWVLPG
jgi:hypothetical protein